MTEKKKEVKKEEEQVVPSLINLLKDFENAPSEVEIEKWKQKFGEVFVSGFSETEMFVWRPLSRMEYTELQKKLRASAQQQGEEFTEYDFETAVVKACILWGSEMKSLDTKGGSITTLSEQVMTNSNFMDQATAAVLVMKL